MLRICLNTSTKVALNLQTSPLTTECHGDAAAPCLIMVLWSQRSSSARCKSLMSCVVTQESTRPPKQTSSAVIATEAGGKAINGHSVILGPWDRCSHLPPNATQQPLAR